MTPLHKADAAARDSQAAAEKMAALALLPHEELVARKRSLESEIAGNARHIKMIETVLAGKGG